MLANVAECIKSHIVFVQNVMIENSSWKPRQYRGEKRTYLFETFFYVYGVDPLGLYLGSGGRMVDSKNAMRFPLPLLRQTRRQREMISDFLLVRY
jgi:hypothetical protein